MHQQQILYLASTPLHHWWVQTLHKTPFADHVDSSPFAFPEKSRIRLKIGTLRSDSARPFLRLSSLNATHLNMMRYQNKKDKQRNDNVGLRNTEKSHDFHDIFQTHNFYALKHMYLMTLFSYKAFRYRYISPLNFTSSTTCYSYPIHHFCSSHPSPNPDLYKLYSKSVLPNLSTKTFAIIGVDFYPDDWTSSENYPITLSIQMSNIFSGKIRLHIFSSID